MPLRRFRAKDRTREDVELDASAASNRSEDAVGARPAEEVTGEQPAEELHHSHRVLPILSGLLCPFAVLLEIPGLTQRWYVREDALGNVVETQANPAILNVGLAISLVLAVGANVALIFRFTEKKPRLATLISIACLLVHDVINIVTVAIFGVVHAVDDGFTYGEPYYMTIASTAVSVLCSCTLILDYYQTPDFKKNGSGLSQKQRLLVIVVMVLLVYLALGSMAFSLMLELTFITSMYFVLVTISTTGYGDIVPTTKASQIFSYFYDTAGIVLVALTIAIGRSTIIEGFERSYRRRRDAMAERVRERKIERQERFRRRREKRRTEGTLVSKFIGRSATGESSPSAEEELAGAHHDRALEFHRELDHGVASHHSRWIRFLRRTRLLSPDLTPSNVHSIDITHPDLPRTTSSQSDSSQQQFLSFRNQLEKEKTREFRVKLAVALSLFVVFWIIGATVFKHTEGWSWFEAFFFCYVTFTTIGYGPGPSTSAGRALWICYALFGIAIMTILLSVLTERATRTAERVSRQSVSQIPLPSPPAFSLPALEFLPRHTLEAVQSFDAHARYFINGRQGEIPEELRALLTTADGIDATASELGHGEELSGVQGDEQRSARAHYLFLISYERSLETVKRALESTESVFQAQAKELVQVRKVNANLRRELDSRDVAPRVRSTEERRDNIDDDEVEEKLVAELDRENGGGEEDDEAPPPASPSSPSPDATFCDSPPSTRPSNASSSTHDEQRTTALLHLRATALPDDIARTSPSHLQRRPLSLSPLDSSISSRTDLSVDTTTSSPSIDPFSPPAPTASSQSVTRRSASTAGVGMASRTSTLTFLVPESNR